MRGYVHQVPAGRSPKRRPNLVQRKRRNGFCGNTCTKSTPAVRQKGSQTWCKGNGGTGFCGDTCTKFPPAARQKGARTWCKGNEGTGFAGIRAPNPRRPFAKKAPRLGAKETEEQGFAGIRAPSTRRPASATQSPRAGRAQKITKSVKTPGASGSIPLLSGLAASQSFLGFDGFKSAGSSYFSKLSISSWMS